MGAALRPAAAATLLAVATAVAAMATRRAALRRHAGLLDARAGLGDDGVLTGAGTIDLRRAGGDRAALVLHGFGDTPQSVAHLADYLHGAGWAVRAPLLPGHGRTLRAFGRSSAADWLELARGELAALRARHRRVVIVGQSMGGALATILAAESPAPPAIVLLAPYLGMPAGVRRLARLHRLWSPLLPYVDSGGATSILDEAERERSLSYGAVNGRVLHELLVVVERAQAAQSLVRSPLLIVQSRRDNRIAEDVTRTAFGRFGSERKRLVWLDEGGHVLTVDHGRDRLFALVSAWLDGEVVPGDATPQDETTEGATADDATADDATTHRVTRRHAR